MGKSSACTELPPKRCRHPCKLDKKKTCRTKYPEVKKKKKTRKENSSQSEETKKKKKKVKGKKTQKKTKNIVAAVTTSAKEELKETMEESIPTSSKKVEEQLIEEPANQTIETETTQDTNTVVNADPVKDGLNRISQSFSALTSPTTENKEV